MTATNQRPRPSDIPIAARPPLTWRRTLVAVAFGVIFDLAAVLLNTFQIVFLLPLRVVPLKFTRQWSKEGMRHIKGAFGCLLILMCQWFAPTELRITFETKGQGAFTEEEMEQVAPRDKSGRVKFLNLPTRFVLISNHQVYADWWYQWCLLYFIGPRGVHRDIYITLKKSLKWIPIVGWGMQLFDFIFLARSWVEDRSQLAYHLSALGTEAEKQDLPFAFFLYPEGTLVSKDTRPISRKYADKTGIDDMTNILLPRSTGLHYTLRSLVPRIPDLHLIDLTVVYPGIPPLGYGQSYYTLRSIFFDGVPPPSIHIHMRKFHVQQQVPIGDLSATNPKTLPDTSSQRGVVEIDPPDVEKQAFDLWLRRLWQDKDESISHFLANGQFVPEQSEVATFPLEL